MLRSWLLHFATSYYVTWAAHWVLIVWICLEGQARDLRIRHTDGLVEYMRSYERIGALLAEDLTFHLWRRGITGTRIKSLT